MSFPALYQPGINMAHNARGHYGKIRPRVLTNQSGRYKFASSGHIIRCIKPQESDFFFSQNRANRTRKGEVFGFRAYCVATWCTTVICVTPITFRCLSAEHSVLKIVFSSDGTSASSKIMWVNIVYL